MPEHNAFKVRVTRRVSRTVWLNQHADLYIKAPNARLAYEAAREMALGCSMKDIEEFVTEWEDDDASRQASNDELDRPCPYEVREYDVSPSGVPTELTYEAITGISLDD